MIGERSGPQDPSRTETGSSPSTVARFRTQPTEGTLSVLAGLGPRPSAPPEVRWVERIGRIEGYSWLLLLFVAMPLKYGLGFPLAVSVVGRLHGFLFVVFVAVLAWSHFRLGWSWLRSTALFFTALLPFGFLAAPRWLDTPASPVASD